MRIESLSSRVFLIYALFALMWMSGLLLFTWMSYQAGQESVAQKLLVLSVETWLEDPDQAYPLFGGLSFYEGEEDLPQEIADNLEAFEAEDYEVPLWEWNELHMWKGVDPRNGQRVFAVLDLGDTADESIFVPNLNRAVCVGILLFLISALGIGFLISRRVTRPLRQLCAEIRKMGPGVERPDLASAFPDGEPGEVARAFDTLNQRVQRFAERERRFTAYASHELRTPLTLMHSATAVLRNSLTSPSEKQQRALGHLAQGADEMTRSVESFLLLARERELAPGEAEDAPGELLQNLLKQQQEQLHLSPERIQLRITGEPPLRVPAEFFRIAAENLTRNAFLHGGDGQVRILLSEQELRVEDEGPGLPPEVEAAAGKAFQRGESSSGLGLGMSITREIAERAGWRVEWQRAEAAGTRVRLQFQAVEP